MTNEEGNGFWIGVAVSVVLAVVAFGALGEKNYSGPWVSVDQQTIRSGLTQRERTLVTFQQGGTMECNFSIFNRGITRSMRVEVPKDVNVPAGIEMTREQIDELKGRSRLGKAWDFLLKPKESK